MDELSSDDLLLMKQIDTGKLKVRLPIINEFKVPVAIRYTDAKNETTIREIFPLSVNIENIIGGDIGAKSIEARCLKAKAKRTFRIDRILDIFDPSTGEVIDLSEWLNALEFDMSPMRSIEERFERLQPLIDAEFERLQTVTPPTSRKRHHDNERSTPTSPASAPSAKGGVATLWAVIGIITLVVIVLWLSH